MPSYDISRVAFDPRKHYSSVRMQQGRVLTDDDWNENERIDSEERRRSRIDIIGPFGSPDNGFRVRNLTIAADGTFDFQINAGTLHVGGHRLELDRQESYRAQYDWLQQPPAAGTAPLPANLPAGQERFDMAYIEAWQQPVSAVEDDTLLEAALGGPDTTTRLRTTRRVLIQPNIDSDDCNDAWRRLVRFWFDEGLGRLSNRHERIANVTMTVGFTGAGAADDLCTPAVAGGYLGAENQAIRVEFTDNSHFTWGFDNAAPLYRVRVTASANGLDTLTLLTQPTDQHHWPLAGQIVEVLPWAERLSNGRKTAERRGHFSRVSGSYNPDNQQITIGTPLSATFGTVWKTRPDAVDLALPEPGEFLYLRVWQRGDDSASAPEIAFVPGMPVALGNTGLSVTFTGPDRVANDHWVIAVRPETPNQLVPWELTTGMPPVGIRRFVAPLGIIRWTNVGGVIEGAIVHDCRRKFKPLTEPDCCCTYTVGDGIRSQGDYNSIQAAIDNLPKQGGRICVLPGLHRASARIINRQQIHISGCGEQTIVWAIEAENAPSIFSIQNSQRVTIERLTLVTLDGVAVTVRDTDSKQKSSAGITIQHNRILACIHAIYVHLNEQQAGNNQISIEHNQIGMIDKPTGLAAIFTLADEVLIERNRIVLVPDTRADDPTDPRDPTDPNDPFDPCFDRRKFAERPDKQYGFVAGIFLYVGAYVVGANRPVYQAQGGIQVGGSSERVQIRRNEIIGGWGNGITLGHVPAQHQEIDPRQYIYSQVNQATSEAFLSTIYDLTIDDNQIRQMGLSGIGVVAFFSRRQVGLAVRVDTFVITQNTIEYCALQSLDDVADELRDEIAVGGIVLTHAKDGQIRDNRIEQNGPTAMHPACGVFIAFGEKIGLSDNQILNNGLWVEVERKALQPGNRGGIVIKMALKVASFLKTTRPSDDALPAVWIHDNVVNQPLGHALFLIAMGPVSVSDNYFTSQGINISNPFSRLAGSVFILNLGLSKDLILYLMKVIAKGQNKAGWADLLATSEGQQLIRAVQYLPSGKVLFGGNQTALDMRADTRTFAVSSQLIASLDDIGFLGNQSECEALLLTQEQKEPKPGNGNGITFDLVLVNTMLVGASVRANDNRFTDGLTATLYSLVSLGLLNTATGNQATHCLHVLGLDVAENSNLILIDDRCATDKAQLDKMLAGHSV